LKNDKQHLKWLEKLLMISQKKYWTLENDIWVCARHPLLPDFPLDSSDDLNAIECTCGAPGMIPLKLPDFVNGFCCALPNYRVKR